MLHGGDILSLAERAGCAPDALLDCSASINPYGPPLWLRDVLARASDALQHYPDPHERELLHAASERFCCAVEAVLPCPGTESLIRRLPQALAAQRLVLPTPCYGGYEQAAGVCSVLRLPADLAQSFAYDMQAVAQAIRPGDMVLLGHPGNPNGRLLEPEPLRWIMDDNKDVIFVIDEAFIELCDDAPSFVDPERRNLLVLRSLSKCFAIPGLRVGLAIGAESLLQLLRQDRPCWELGTLEQAVASACLYDQQYLEESREQLRQWRAQCARDLALLPGCQVLPGQANWHLLKLPVQHDADTVASACLRQGVALRSGAGIGGLGPAWLRIAVRRPEENERCLHALRQVLGGAPDLRRPRRTPALMLQGCSSDAGKSLLTAGICRIMLQDGFDVAPFKAQNMANNAGVTRDGLEIGRAQMLQAQACRLEPDVRMNPVLLKPTGERGCQVVLMGQARGCTDVHGYHAMKREAQAVALSAYDNLAAEHEVMLVEGAGSPGEVNLRGKDFVNMAMAAHARARVLLVGDIDRGGVYASLAGHCETFTPAERALLAGFVINKFRGDASLLEPAHAWLQRRTGVPVLGVLRHLGRHGLPEEDSLGLSSGWPHHFETVLRIGVIALPHLANASDLDPLAGEPDCELRLIHEPAQIQGCQLLIIPGSKAVISDLQWLRRSGLDNAVTQAAARGVEVIGICGGMQMLGASIADPHGLEGQPEVVGCLGMYPWCTTLAPAKTRCLSSARDSDGRELQGYEIHHGCTDWGQTTPWLTTSDGRCLGAGAGGVRGCYLHGLFDNDDFRHDLLNRLRASTGLAPLSDRPHYDLEAGLDRLADAIREAIDMPALYHLLGVGAWADR